MVDAASSKAKKVNPRRGWIRPAKPGPTNLQIMLSVAIVIVGLILWATLSIDITRSVLNKHKVSKSLILHIDSSGRMKSDGVQSGKAKIYRSKYGIDYVAVPGNFVMRSNIENLNITAELPVFVEEQDVVIRARTPSAVVDLDRTKDDSDAPIIDIKRVRSGDIDVQLLVLIPVEGMVVGAVDNPPSLTKLTKPFDQDVVRDVKSGRRLAWLRNNVILFSILVFTLGIMLPLGWLIVVRRGWYYEIPKSVPGELAPTTAPSNRPPLTAAAITRGSMGLKRGPAFAGQVLDMIARDVIKLHHTFDPNSGEGSALNIGEAMIKLRAGEKLKKLDKAALELLCVLASANGELVQLPDVPHRVNSLLQGYKSELLKPRAEWLLALDDHIDEVGIVEHAKWERASLLALIGGILVASSALVALFSSLDGTRALAWYVLILSLGPALLLGLLGRDQQRWVRVKGVRKDERLKWLAWREVLNKATGDSTFDQAKNLPYAAASGSVEGIASELAGPTDTGLSAATPKLIAALHAIARSDGTLSK